MADEINGVTFVYDIFDYELLQSNITILNNC